MNTSIIAACVAGLLASACVAQCAKAETAHAETFFEIEAGIGAAHIKDMGDGTWIQQGAPNNREKVNSPAFMVGFTGSLYETARYDVRWHADYVYLGSVSASVDGVPDQYYNPSTHQVSPTFAATGDRYSPFNGQGHTQGVALTLDGGYTTHGYRFGVEAGPWIYWQTWHESLYDLAGNWDDLSHKTSPQLGYVVGASVARGPWSVSYRYYGMKARWNPYPGLATSAHMLTLNYRF